MNRIRREWAPIANRSIADEIANLSEEQREHFEERAGILQYDGGLPSPQAEAVALQQIKGTSA